MEGLARDAFTPIWTHEVFRRGSFARPVAVHSHTAYVITTRIDSDDAMATDFMAAVQGQFCGQERLFVNFPRGIQIDRSGAVYRADVLSSPFLSLIERRRDGEPPATVYVAKHARARAHGSLREVKAPVMWAQVLHGSNLSNIVNGVRVHPKVVGERFEFDLGYDATLARAALVRGQAGHLGRLARLWAAHPGEFTKWAEARAWTLRGTHERGQEAGAPTLTDRVQTWERDTRKRLRHARWALKGRANEAMPSRERLVSGDLESVLAKDRVVVLAEWSARPAVRDDALRAARAYAEAGFGVLLVAARDPWVRLTRADVPHGVAVVRRANTAYDFGSWAHVLRTWPQIADKSLVVLTNDSLIGPLGPLDEMLRRLRASAADVWGVTATRQPADHVHSFFLAFRGGVLAPCPLRDFFANVSQLESKRDVVVAYEIGLTQVLEEAGLRREAGWTQEELGLSPDVVLPLWAWRGLMAAGFPFVKRVLLTAPQFADQRAVLAQVLGDKILSR